MTALDVERTIIGRTYRCVQTQTHLALVDGHVVVVRLLHPDVPGHLVEETKTWFRNGALDTPYLATIEKTVSIRVR